MALQGPRGSRGRPKGSQKVRGRPAGAHGVKGWAYKYRVPGSQGVACRVPEGKPAHFFNCLFQCNDLGG